MSRELPAALVGQAYLLRFRQIAVAEPWVSLQRSRRHF